MQEPISQFERVIGLDSHPDSFTAALVRGPTPAAAVVEKMFNKVPLSQLTKWAQEHTTPADLCVLEASGNSFYVARSLEAIGRRARVLESTQLGRLKEAHANNDKLSAERIAKAYLAGTTKSVWVPDLRTQERRDCFHAYEKVTKRTTQLRNRLKSYLSDQGVRLAPDTALNAESLRPLRTWSTRQWQIVAGLLLELRHAEEQDEHWRSFMAQEVLEDPQLLALVRQCGVADVVAFAVGAIVGDIHRFARPGSLVKYAGLNPACDDSGNGQWHGGIGGHGRRDLRALLMEAAQSLLRSGDPLGRWGKRLLARKGSVSLSVAAVARRLLVAIWYLLMGRWDELKKVDAPLKAKVSRIITHLGAAGLQRLGQSASQVRAQAQERLKAYQPCVLGGKVYARQPDGRWTLGGPAPVATAPT